MLTKSSIQHLPLTKARINLGAVIRRIRLNKELFILEKDGIPVAALVGIDDLEDYMELRDPELRSHIRRSYREYVEGKARPVSEFLAEMKKLPAKSKRAKK
jgi:antitoxin (DNA-binding transcriptional repressor) of toxin-antitoxin stability system